MRLVIQRVNKAKVSVSEKVVGKIEKGLFILVGIGEGDTTEEVKQLAEKVKRLRIIPDSDSKMNLSVTDANASILAVSQFTLYSDTSKGNRPSFVKAAKPEDARNLYEYFVEQLKIDVYVETGRFGEYMNISAEMDGPVTIILSNAKNENI